MFVSQTFFWQCHQCRFLFTPFFWYGSKPLSLIWCVYFFVFICNSTVCLKKNTCGDQSDFLLQNFLFECWFCNKKARSKRFLHNWSSCSVTPLIRCLKVFVVCVDPIRSHCHWYGAFTFSCSFVIPLSAWKKHLWGSIRFFASKFSAWVLILQQQKKLVASVFCITEVNALLHP